MKKILMAVICLSLLVMFSACSKDRDDGPIEMPTGPIPGVTEKEDNSIDDSVQKDFDGGGEIDNDINPFALVNFEELEGYITAKQYENVYDSYNNFFQALYTTKIDNSNFEEFKFDNEDLLATYFTFDDVHNLEMMYNKFTSVGFEETCYIVLEENSIVDNDEFISFVINLVADKNTEIKFYTQFSKNNFNINIE